ncbi:hypothetical protein L1D19_05850 [Vibrio natriegens]|uniref:hypothetical protein n=1 Tax=Vibrio natriegens TaxID=691 RepID=UPI001EFDCB75|nr:hypothetical protein [Vibrio natriegens]MCG9699655.1 hypothetical protein [Vibrio natriegens]
MRAIKAVLELNLIETNSDIMDMFCYYLADLNWSCVDASESIWEKTFNFPNDFLDAVRTNVHLDLETASMHTASTFGLKGIQYSGCLKIALEGQAPIVLSNILY